MSELLQRAAERVQDSMDEILTNFKPGAKITVLVRAPDKPTADFCMTSDDLEEVIAMVQRRKGAAPSPETRGAGEERDRMQLASGYYNSFEVVIGALEKGGEQAQAAGHTAHGACLLHAAVELRHVWDERKNASSTSLADLGAWTPPPESERVEGFECLAFIPVRWERSFANPQTFQWGVIDYYLQIEGTAKGWAPLPSTPPPETGESAS